MPHRLPAPAPLLAALLVAVLVLQVGSLTRVALAHPDSYTPAADIVATVRGQPCGLQPLLSVELRPGAGLLLPRPGPTSEPVAAVRTVDIGGRALPGITVAGRQPTGWFVLDPAQRAQRLPVVVTVSGALRVADQLFLEFGDEAGQVVQRRRIDGPDPAAVAAGYPERDDRQLAPPTATAVRLAVEAPPAGPAPPATVSVPRVPRLTPLVDVLPPGEDAVLDWPVAFQFPCLRPAALALGTASVPGWRVAPPGVGRRRRHHLPAVLRRPVRRTAAAGDRATPAHLPGRRPAAGGGPAPPLGSGRAAAPSRHRPSSSGTSRAGHTPDMPGFPSSTR